MPRWEEGSCGRCGASAGSGRCGRGVEGAREREERERRGRRAVSLLADGGKERERGTGIELCFLWWCGAGAE